MEALTIGMTYGTALFEAARDVGKVNEIAEELGELEAAFSEEPLFFELVMSPSLTANQKKESINQVFENKISEELLNFMCILIDKRRMGQFKSIAREYRKQMNEKLGIAKGTIYSVEMLSEAQLTKFEEETGKLLQKKVKLENLADAKLIGGVKIFIEGKLIDASIRKRLDDLRESLM